MNECKNQMNFGFGLLECQQTKNFSDIQRLKSLEMNKFDKKQGKEG